MRGCSRLCGVLKRRVVVSLLQDERERQGEHPVFFLREGHNAECWLHAKRKWCIVGILELSINPRVIQVSTLDLMIISEILRLQLR